MNKAITLGMAVGACVAVAVCPAYLLTRDSPSGSDKAKAGAAGSLRHVELPPLPHGKRRITSAHFDIAVTNPTEMMHTATVIFVGTAIAEGEVNS